MAGLVLEAFGANEKQVWFIGKRARLSHAHPRYTVHLGRLDCLYVPGAAGYAFPVGEYVKWLLGRVTLYESSVIVARFPGLQDAEAECNPRSS